MHYDSMAGSLRSAPVFAGPVARVTAFVVDVFVFALSILFLRVIIESGLVFAMEAYPLYAAEFSELRAVVMPCLLALSCWVVIWCWSSRGATPGKHWLALKLIDARTGVSPTFDQAALRFFTSILSLLPFGLGFLWALIDKRGQSWHDKLSGVMVVRA